MMFKKILKTLFVIFCLATVFYLALPNYAFPPPPPGSLQSREPADTETPLRRAYFTNFTRAQVLEWYKAQFEEKTILGIKLPAYLLNYPPEDAATIIRDQTRSSYLQEVVHPMRESIYINGFEPASAKDAIFIDGRVWQEKITVRYVPSSPWVREAIFIASAGMIVSLYSAFAKTLKKKK